MLKRGQQIGRYEILGFLGRGGMATVYRVRHRKLGSQHALKLVHVRWQRVRDRLMREGRAQASLVHPNIVRVTDVLFHDEDPVLVMELVDGLPLDAWLRRRGRADLGTALALAIGITRGLAAAHGQGLVHRDLKPSNVLLARTPQGLLPKIMDFGLVKVVQSDRRERGALTRSGIAMGTPNYMAPEQIRDASNVDHRADLYSLGVLLHLLFCDRLPFEVHTLMGLYYDILRGDYPPLERSAPGLPPVLGELVRGLLRPSPDARISSCGEVLKILEDPTARMVSGPSTLRPIDLLRTAARAPSAWDTRYGRHPVEGKPWRATPALLRAAPLLAPVWIAGSGLALAAVAPAPEPIAQLGAGEGPSAESEPPRPPVPPEPAGSPQPPGPEIASPRPVGVEGATPAVQPELARLEAARPGAGRSEAVAAPAPSASGEGAPGPGEPPGAGTAQGPDGAPDVRSAPKPRRPRPRARWPHVGVEVEAGSRVWLVREGRRSTLPGPVEPGTYEVVALFEGTEPVSAGSVTVGEVDLTLRCSAFAQRCLP